MNSKRYYFTNSSKVLVVIINEKWEDCIVFIYDINNQSIDRLSDKGYPSYFRHLIACANMSFNKRMSSFTRESYEGERTTLIKYEDWIQIEESVILQYEAIEKELRQINIL